MQDGSQFIEIIFFAVLAIFIGLRLRSVLGQRTGNEPTAKPGLNSGPNNVVDLAARRPDPAVRGPSDDGLGQIGAIDPTFSPDRFLQGAGTAFGMIVTAFARSDEPTLRPLLSDQVFANFSQALRSRRAAGEVCENQLEAVDNAEILDAQLEEGRTAFITVRFTSRQVVCQKDTEGKLLYGDPAQAVVIVDLWTFSRDLRGRSPNWLLVATHGPEA